MAEAFIYDAVRTPRGRGKPDGSLHEVPAVDLAVTALDAIRSRNDLDPILVEDVVLGCVDPVGEAGGDIARAAALKAGFGKEVPGVQINRFCASGLDAVNLAAAQVMSGMKDIAIGGGVESMSRIGMGASGGAWPVDPGLAIRHLLPAAGHLGRSDRDEIRFLARRRGCLCGRIAEARREGLGRGALCQVRRAGEGRQRPDHPCQDEHMRPQTDMQSLGQLKAAFVQMGEMGGFDAVATAAHPDVEFVNHVHHAGNSSGIVDGAAAVLVGTKEGGTKAGLKPRARLKGFASIGSDLALMLTGPIDVSELALRKAGMTKDDIDLFEINEAFSSVVLRYMQAMDLDPAKVNVNGGAIAMGHPLGATGAMILGTVLDELERTNKQTALITLCVAAGMGTAAIIERV